MAKRTVSFAESIETRKLTDNLDTLDEFDLPEGDEKKDSDTEVDEDGIPIKKAKKHTLDSDEEEEEDHKRLDMKRVEGQEDCQVDFDGDTKITAFNMKEEEEEGHFDADGNFIFDKKGQEITDAWLDNIDWGAIKKKAGEQWEKEDEANNSAPVMDDSRRRKIYQTLIGILKPGQTVSQALAAIKKKTTLSAAEERKLRWAAKKAGKALEETQEQKQAKELSTLADDLLTSGQMEAYEWSRERFETMLQKMDHVAVDDLDMFGDAPAASTSKGPEVDDKSQQDDVLMWEYKDSSDADIQGPFTSAEMLEKQEKGELTSDGLARKIGSGGFNPVRRIDFDLYV